MEDGPLVTVADYSALVEQQGTESFLAERDHPFLVALDDLRPSADPGQGEARRAVGRITTLHGAAGSVGWAKLFGGRDKLRKPRADSTVFAVQARDGSSSGWRVSVGRTRINDVQLPHDGVSKFHAYFTWSHDRVHFFVTDSGTTNGTTVNGNKLIAKKPAQLTDGDRLQLGPCELVFFGKQAFLELVQKLSGS